MTQCRCTTQTRSLSSVSRGATWRPSAHICMTRSALWALWVVCNLAQPSLHTAPPQQQKQKKSCSPVLSYYFLRKQRFERRFGVEPSESFGGLRQLGCVGQRLRKQHRVEPSANTLARLADGHQDAERDEEVKCGSVDDALVSKPLDSSAPTFGLHLNLERMMVRCLASSDVFRLLCEVTGVSVLKSLCVYGLLCALTGVSLCLVMLCVCVLG